MFIAELESLLENRSFSQVKTTQEVTFSRDIQDNGEFKEVLFSIVQDEHKRGAARDLLNGRYGWRGYGSTHDLRSDIHHTTFVAEIDEQVVGTLTLGVDSDCGLAIDRTFAEVVDQARCEPGTRICELTKLAFAQDVRSKPVLAGLFHLAYIYGTAHTDCTDLFIEVNPRHLRFYEMMLGFRGVGSLSTNASVAAPSRLLRIDVDTIRRNIRAMAGAAPIDNARSLYPYFFPFEEERQIRRSLGSAWPSQMDRFGHAPNSRAEGYIDDSVALAAGNCSVTRHMRSAA